MNLTALYSAASVRLISALALAVTYALATAGCDANNTPASEQSSVEPAVSPPAPPEQVDSPQAVQTELLPGAANRIVRTILDGDVDRFRAYLEAGIDANEQDVNGYALLHHAVDAGQYEIVKLLIEYGADVNRKARLNLTPLHIVARRGRVDLAQALVEAGAEINPLGAAGNQYTPTRIAAQLRHYQLEEYLRSVGGRQ